jgi:hypothetical protein
MAAWLLFSLALAAGCASRPAARPGDDEAALRLAEALHLRGESLQTMAARGSAGYSADGRRHYVKFEVAVMKPDRMLFTAFDPAGRPAFKLASDGQTLTGIQYGSGEFVSGPAAAANFSRFIPLNLEVSELAALLSGFQAEPASAGARRLGDMTELTVVPTGGDPDGRLAWRLRLKGPPDQDPKAAAVESASFGPPRNPELEIVYRSIKPTPREDLGGLEPFPYSLDIAWRDGARRGLKVNYEEVRLGLPLETGLFSLKPPEGFEARPLD